MPEVRTRRRVSPHVRRAQQLLQAGLVGGHVAALTIVGLFLALSGPNAAATTAICTARAMV